MLLAHRSWGRLAGPLALLVHGGTDTSYTWDDVGNWLAERGWHAIAVDLRGHGESSVSAAANEPSLANMAADLVETAASIRPDRVAVELLVAHSLGTRIALACATRHPTFVERLVLEEPPGDSLEIGTQADNNRMLIEMARADPEAFAKRVGHRMVDPRSATPETIAARTKAVASTDPVYFPRMAARVAEIKLAELASRCTVPTLLVVGRDKGTPIDISVEMGRELSQYSALSGEDRARVAEALRHVTIVELDGAHNLHQPCRDEFVAQLANWLATTDAPVPNVS